MNLLWERTNPSLAWLMPQQGFWSDDEVLVETEKKNFTRSNIGEFFDGYKEHNMAMMVEDTKGLLGGLPPPQVEVFCIHGSQVNTTERVIYPPGSFPPSSLAARTRKSTSNESKNLKWWPFPTEPSLVKGDGDGTVNIRSLKGCLKWEGAQKQAVHHKVFKGINHVDMLRREEPTSYVVNIIDGLNKQLQKTEEELSEAAQQVNSREVAEELLGEDGQEDCVEGELVGAEIQLDQPSDAEEYDSLNTHHGIFPIIEVSSGKK